MSSASGPASSTRLVAILLVTRSKEGTQIAYHYPPVPPIRLVTNRRRPDWYGTPGSLSDLSDSSDDDDSESDQDKLLPGQDTTGKHGSHGSKGKGSGGKLNIHGSIKSSRQQQGSAEDLDEDMPHRLPHRFAMQNRLQDHSRHDSLKQKGPPEWESLFGFSVDGLSKLLSPNRAFNKRRFEVAIDGFVYLGSPRFVRDDGFWKKPKKPKRKDHSNQVDSPNQAGSPKENPADSESHNRDLESDDADVPVYGAAYGHGLISGAASTYSTDSEDQPELNMFNLVFVLQPPALEHLEKVEEMYENVSKKFAKALNYAQAENDFVNREAQNINLLKEEAREKGTPMSILWAHIAKESVLARAIVVTFNAVYDEKIAHINLGQDFDTSFQIPRPTSTQYAPTPMDPQVPGLWLTTAAPMDDEDAETALANHALLLLEEKQILLDEVTRDAKELSVPLAHFIEHVTPTKSLKKVAALCKMSLNDVKLLARHLIYWRRGRAVPPLRPMDYYVVSANSDLKSLQNAIAQFSAKFPTLPSLPKVLSSLSGPPRPYGTLIPTKTHRDKYMEILAWLLRGGWVSQLRTFGWITVPPAIKASVAVKMETEAKQRASQRSTSGNSNVYTGAENSPVSGQVYRNFSGPESHISPGGHRSLEFGEPSPLLLGQKYPLSDTASFTSERTALHNPTSPIIKAQTSTFNRAEPLLKPKTNIELSTEARGAEDASSPPSPTSETQPSPHMMSSSGHIRPNDAPLPKVDITIPSVIACPQRATDVESRWIEAIGAALKQPYVEQRKKATLGVRDDPKGSQASTDDPIRVDLAQMWPILVKHFDGRHAMEDIFVREGIKKKRVAEMVHRLVVEQYLVVVRHW
jgi:nitrogen permease regulator 3-like protein